MTTDTNFDGVIDPAAAWPDVPQLSQDAVAQGGADGPMNAQAKALNARIKQLAASKADSTALATTDAKAVAAQTAADAANAAASAAQTAASNAQTAAGNAVATANSASTAAGNAVITANAAQATANAAMPKSGGNYTGPANANKGADIASASAVAIGAATGEYVTITGTTTITAFDTAQAGAERVVCFAGTLTLTHNATSLILPGKANITTAAGDIARFKSDGGGNWRCVGYMRADGSTVVGGGRMVLTALQATTSGVAIDFTSIPSWAKKITFLFNSVKTSGTSPIEIRLGTSSGVEASGYAGACSAISGSAVGSLVSGTGITTYSGGASFVRHGSVSILLQSGNTWAWSGVVSYEQTSGSNVMTGGAKTIAGQLDRVRLTTVNGTDTFTTGSVSMLIEG